MGVYDSPDVRLRSQRLQGNLPGFFRYEDHKHTQSRHHYKLTSTYILSIID